MRAVAQMKRLAQFCRSVLPADPWHLVFLIGVVLVFVCGHASWWPKALFAECGAPYGDPSLSATFGKFRLLIIAVCYLTIFSGVAGYFLCFWPGKRQLLRVFCFAWAPSAIGLVLFVGKLHGLCKPASVLHFKFAVGSFLGWLKANATHMPTGPAVCAAGLGLILVFAVRLALGKSALPIEIWQTNDKTAGEDWTRIRALTFVLVGPYFLLAGLVGTLLFSPALFLNRSEAGLFEAISDVANVLEAGLLIGVALVVLKVSWKNVLGAHLHPPKLLDAMVAVVVPVGVTLILPAGHYLFDRIQWAAHEFGRYSPPSPFAYFDISNSMHLFVVLTLFASTAEEIVFRGMMLPAFVGRYGTQRGIFLLGIVWAAIHFRSDSYSRMSLVGLLEQIGVRVGICLVLNYVLSWMTLRQGSVTCAAITHGVWNLLNLVPQRDALAGELGIRFAVLGAVALILFRFWPIKEGGVTFGSAEADGAALAT